MHSLDWVILLSTLLGITFYGVWKTRGSRNLESYLAASRSTPWWAIGLSIMATQASAITFISTPGLGYEQGLRFAQFYYGLPIAMIIVAIWFAPRFFHAKVFTAYEFLENRFNLNTRLFTAALFLIQRGLATGVTIYAPSIILSQVLGWNLLINIWIIGVLVIIYTVSGGTKAVTQTHKQQMLVIFLGLVVSFSFLLYYINERSSLAAVLELAERKDLFNAFDLKFDLSDRYNVWSGILGGTFLMLSYFGTDQSQVQRYISGKSLREIRIGLLFNGILKIPLQFFILFIGILVMGFYCIYEKPLYFDSNKEAWLEKNHTEVYEKANSGQQEINALKLTDSKLGVEQLVKIDQEQQHQSHIINSFSSSIGFKSKVKESDYIFISWVLNWLPKGLVGLLLAVIFSAAMSSTAAELNALATTSTVDFYQRLNKGTKHEGHFINSSKLFTILWGLIAIGFASVASLFDNLVEFVNILGSLFYGTVLGIFLVALYLKKIGSLPTLIGGIVAQAFIFFVHFNKGWLDRTFHFELSYLWYNLIACVLVVMIAGIIEGFKKLSQEN